MFIGEKERDFSNRKRFLFSHVANFIHLFQHLLIICTCYSTVQGGVDWRELFHDYIMVWVQEMQLGFLDLCKAEKVCLQHFNLC